MTPSSDRRLSRLAVAAALIAALGLAACGRKGPLELPPNSLAEQPAPTAAQTAQAVQPDSGGPVAPATDARAPKKRIFLDWLLD